MKVTKGGPFAKELLLNRRARRSWFACLTALSPTLTTSVCTEKRIQLNNKHVHVLPVEYLPKIGRLVPCQ